MSANLNTDTFGALNSGSGQAKTHLEKINSQTANASFETPVYIAPHDCLYSTVHRVSFYPTTTITGAATNLQTFTLRVWRNGALVGTLPGSNSYVTTVTNNALVEKTLCVTDQILKPGDILTLKDTPSGTGSITPEISIQVEVIVTPVL